MARVYLKGLPQLKAKLIKLRQDTAGMVRPALGIAAQMVVDTQKRLAPVAPGSVGGDLREAIGWQFGGRARAGVQDDSPRATIFVGNEKVKYAQLVEFGTAPHLAGGMFAGAMHPGTTAQPFFYPGYRARKKEVKSLIRKAIRNAVRSVAR